MFVVHSSLNGLEPEPQSSESLSDEMDSLMSDWSWRDARPDPGYVYDDSDRLRWQVWNAFGFQMPAVRPWSFPAYRGPVVRPPRIGVTR